MTLSGWIFMLTSWTGIIGLFLYCMYRTLRSNRKEKNNPEE